MNEEILKNQYRILRSKLYLIKSKLNELDDMYEDLKLNTKENFVIDENVVFEDCFDKIKIKINNIKKEIVNEVIPSINNKI